MNDKIDVKIGYYDYVACKCETCGKDFQVQYQAIRVGKGRYCSHACSPNFVEANTARRKNPLGASQSAVTRTCPTCSKDFVTKVKNINRGGGTYCSFKCNPNKFRTTEEAKVIRKRAYQLRINYGITQEDFEKRKESQKGVCAICGEPPSGTAPNTRHLYVDHNHATGAVRGLLCGRCNTAIGLLRDDAGIITKAAEYVNSWG